MHKYLTQTATLTVLSATLLAAGCGGGGSSGNSSAADVVAPAPVPVPVAVAQRSVSGVASKGTIKKARVQAFALDALGNRGSTAIASAVTGDDGSYTIKIPTTVLTFVIEIDAAAGATMADEASGQDIEFPADMKLRNVVKLAEANDVAVTSHVSPLTELVAKTAESAVGGLNTANIAQAKVGIAAALGFDPEKVKPVNSNSAAAAGANAEERMQSLTLAAISKMALDSKLGCAQATPSARVACVVKEVAKTGTLAGDKLTLGESVRGEVRAALVAVAANPTINKTGAASVVGYAAFAQSVVPTAAGTLTGVGSAKKLFGSLRTNLQAWSDSTKTGGKLSTQFHTVIGDFSKAIEPIDPDSLLWVALMSRGLDQLADFKAGLQPAASSEREYANGARGTCTVYSDEALTVKATSPTNALNVACSVARFARFQRNVGTVSSYSFVKLGTDISITPVAGQTNAFSYKARAFRQTGTANERLVIVATNPKTTIGNYGSALTDRASGTLTYAKSGDLYANFAVSGMMPARFTDDGIALTDNQTWNVKATRTVVEGKLVTYGFAGDVTANKAGVAVGKVSIREGSFARVVEEENGSVGIEGVKEFKLSVVAEAGTSKIEGSLHFENFMADFNGFNTIPSKVAFTGSMSQGETPFFVGSLALDSVGYAKFNNDLPESSTNFVKLTASLSGTFTVAARPPLVIIASVSHDALDSYKESAQYNDGTTVLTASRVTNGVSAPVISIASTEGVSLKLAESGNVDVDVTKDNAKVAVLNIKTGVITYADGSFESLK